MKDVGRGHNLERRKFFETASKAGFTAAVIAGTSGLLLSPSAVASVAREERERKKNSSYTMVIASPYILGTTRSYPIMQLDLKENIQNFTNGKIYVNLAPGGQLGTGGALAQKVQTGTIQAAEHSVANFAPFAPVVDLINIPYWCADNQKFANLINSKIWNDEVSLKLRKRGFKALLYMAGGPRTVALRRGLSNIVKTPEQIKGIKIRVPGSKILQQFYTLLGANPTPIAWGETPAAIKQGVADALDAAVGGMDIYGFGDILSSISLICSVPDSEMYSCNLKWFSSLPKSVQDDIDIAASVTAQQNLAKIPASEAYAMSHLRKKGVKIYKPVSEELALWRKKAGYQLPVWNATKKELAGSVSAFNKFLEAANTQGRYYVQEF